MKNLIAESDWHTRKINSKSFDDLFRIDGISLWWFYHRFFVPWVMPKQINTFHQLNACEQLSSLQKLKLSGASFMLQHFVNYNEKKKINFFPPKTIFSSEPKVLFLSYSNHISEDGKLFRLDSVLDNLKSRQIPSVTLYVDPLSKKTYRKLRGNDTMYQYHTTEIDRTARSFARETNTRWKKLPKSIKEKMLTIEGKEYWPYLKYAFNVYMSKPFLYSLALYYELSKNAILRENGKVVVVTGMSSLHERCLVAAAKYHNIKTIFIEHGLLLHGTPVNPRILYDTQLAVFSEEFKQKLLEVGVTPAQITVVGPVVYDEIYHYMKPKEKSSKKVFFATSPLIEINYLSFQDYFSKIKKILQQIQQIQPDEVIIKLHPREIYLEEYKKICKELKIFNVKVLRDISRKQYYDLIQQSDYFVHLGSNSSIEAIILNKPVLLINMLDDARMTSWAEPFAIMPIVSYKDDITNALLQSPLEKEKRQIQRQKFIKKYIGKIDGKASERVADLIAKEIRKRI